MIIPNKMPEKITNTCVRWQLESPFFAEFLLRFTYNEEHEFTPTAGVNVRDNKLYFFYNQKFLDTLTEEQVEGLCVHEIMHILNKFHARLGTRDVEIFNISQDAVINETIVDTSIGDRKLVLPPNGVTMDEIRGMGYTDDSISELVYKFLEKKATKIVIVSSGGTGNGSGDEECPACGGGGKEEKEEKDQSGQGGGEGKEGEEKDQAGSSGGNGKDKKDKKKPHDPNCPLCGKNKGQKKVLRTTDDHRSHKELKEIEQAIIEEIVNNARTRSWGNISGNMQSVIKELIKTQSIPWQQKLAKLMSKFVNEPGNVYENTWSKRNRRGLPLPGTRKLSKKVVVSIDTSGSIADEDLKKFFGQIEKIVKDFSTMTLIQWDTQVNSIEPYKKGDWKKIKVKGRGGTDPGDLYKQIHDKVPGTSLVVNFTDGYFSWDFEHFNIPTIWAVVNNDDLKPTFGTKIVIRDSEERNRRSRR